jgi:SAM-dependent methyltransferase
MTETRTPGADELRREVEEKYSAAARAVDGARGASCCGPEDIELFGVSRYDAVTVESVPSEALLASLGCGNPTGVAELRAGERVLDLGSGGGIDVILSARRVGESGKVYGLDFVDDMLALARRNAREAGVGNVEFLKGTIESVPLPAESVDVVISNCVINLSLDKRGVIAEIHRVLAPGGRVAVSDVVAEDRLTVEDRGERGGFSECIAGALAEREYRTLLAEAGFTDIEITFTHEVADAMHGAIVRASKPGRCCG